MRNLMLITLFLLFCVLYSTASRILYNGFYNTRAIEIVKVKDEKDGCELITKLPLLTNTAFCNNHVYNQQGLLELHNTKEVTIGYFLML